LGTKSTYQDDCILLLKSLNDITEEDYEEYSALNETFWDYLRSRGYACPYLNYSVEELINMKYLKLI
jgi:hypothetical protein